jgi:lambda repressor-like predicted transcriptional regulator
MPQKGNEIMHSENDIVAALKARQETMRREMDRRGISLKAVSYDSGIAYSTLVTYFPSQDCKRPAALMPVSAQYLLCGVIPDDILSLLLPADRLIVRVPEALDHDEISEAVQDYLQAKERAHHPESEAGREIGPNEDNVLRGKFARVKAA